VPPERSVRDEFSIRFEGERIELDGGPSLDLILSASGVGDALALDFGTQAAPVPLIALPAPAMLSATANGSADAATLAEALAWTLEIELQSMPAGQDGRPAPVESPPPEATEPLFTALCRAVRFALELPDGAVPKALEPFAILAEAVADALPAWRKPLPQPEELPGQWRYGLDFGSLPEIVVTRGAAGSGALPLWPELSGYSTPADEGETAFYRPEPGAETGAGLRIAWPGFRLPEQRTVGILGRIKRNAGLANPAFVYPGAITRRDAAVHIEWESPRPEPAAASLAAALGAMLAAIEEGSRRPYALGFEAVLVRRPEEADEAPLEVRIPLLLAPPVTIGGPGGAAAADLTREMARALASARAMIDPAAGPEAVGLTVSLFGEAADRAPLARLSVRFPVPGDAAWWGSSQPG
jgi:hypothetical protein